MLPFLCLVLATVSAVQLLRGAAGSRLAPDGAELRAACFFTYALRLDLPGSNHHVIRAADFQRKARKFYDGSPVAAPLEEAYWLLMLPEEFQGVVVQECPAMAVLAYLLVAESQVYLEPRGADDYAEIGWDILRRQEPRLARMLMESWPIAEAWERLQAARLSAQQAYSSLSRSTVLVDIVLAHCREDLSWIQDTLARWAPAGSARLFLYEKCGGFDSASGSHSHSLSALPTQSVQVVDDGPGGRKDECSAYLAHLVAATLQETERERELEPAHYTLFLQADALQHSQPQLLDLVMRAIQHRSLDVPFLHLGQSSMVSSSSPCKRAIIEQLLARPLASPPQSYCCAQFLVRRDALLRPAAAWRRLRDAMDEPLPMPGCEGVRPAAGMHCLVLEGLWHVLFGQHERLPPRAEDLTLPAFLRLPETDASDLPGGARSEAYLGQMASRGVAAAQEAARKHPGLDLSGARSIGYLAASAAPPPPSSG